MKWHPYHDGNLSSLPRPFLSVGGDIDGVYVTVGFGAPGMDPVVAVGGSLDDPPRWLGSAVFRWEHLRYLRQRRRQERP